MKIKDKLQGISLKYKILTVMMTGLITLFLAGIVSLFLISRSYESKLYRSTAASLSYSSSKISEEFEYIDTMIDSLLSNPAIQANLSGAKSSTQRSEKQLYLNHVYNALCDSYFVFNRDSISCLSIIQNESIASTSNKEFLEIPLSIRSDLIRRAKEADGKTTIITDYGPDYGLFIVKELKKIDRLSLEPLGELIVNVDMDRLIASATALSTEYEDASYFLFDQGSLVFNHSSLSNDDALTIYNNLDHNYSVISLKNNKLFAVSGDIPIYQWTYICTTSYSSIYKAITLSSQSFFIIMVLSMILICVFIVKLVPSLFAHFDRLIDNMRRFGEGRYETAGSSTVYRQDEIGLLYKNFDAMVEKINALINENYVNELLKKEAQIKAMESQMDPHFLYNTLDSINWRARMIKSEEISQITTSLGNLLRLSLEKNSKDFTLQRELTLVENYITIQKIRYPKRLNFTVQIPQCFWPTPIPKFTLQPLLENAIRYGLEESSETCYISIHAELQDTTLILTVTNTGSSFEENLLEKLEQGQVLPHGFGIGVLNIHKRIQMTYGSPYGLRLYTIEDEETYEECAVAEVRIPYLNGREIENDVKTFNHR